jgi:uroporphyrinogen decarboxylase
MTSREIFIASLEFQGPPRIPMTLPDPYPNDFFGVGVSEDPNFKPPAFDVPVGRQWMDEWGVVWRSLTDFDKGEVYRGAIEDWSQLDDYRVPDLARADRYDEARRSVAEVTDKYRIGSLPGFVFNIARKIRRLDNYLCDLLAEPDRVGLLHAMIRDKIGQMIDRWAEAGVDGVMFCEDWGTQDRLMISPDMWRELFKPDFQLLCDRAHQQGLHVLMHSCGYIFDIIGDLIEVGIDCLQFDQPTLHGIDRLGDRFGGKVNFWCPVDIQKTLQTRDPAKIEAEARQLVQRLGSYGGGFIATRYGSDEALGLEPSVQDIADRAFSTWGRFEKRS